MFHYTVETHKSVPELVSAIEKNLKKVEFGLMWQVNIEERIQEKGHSLGGDFVVLEVCNPFKAHDFIKTNKLMGYFLPCKIVVYQDGASTKVGMPKITSLVQVIGDDALLETAQEVETILRKVIDHSLA